METEYTLNTLMISADEKAYISCIRGFWIIDPEKRTRHYMPTLRTRKGNVLATEISTIFQDRQGALWLGTFNRGLLYYHPALYKHIHIDKKDFPLSLERNTAVANFTEDRDGNIFIKDRTAIYKLDLQEDGNRILIPVEASTLPKELQGEYGSEAAFVSHDGTLYFGDADGCNIFSPNPEPPSSSLPYPPVFTAIHVHGECILPGRSYENRTILPEASPYVKEISLSHSQNFLTLEFSALNYFNREHTHYRYQLEGIDAQWVTAGNMKQSNGILQAPYTNLPPGSYTFKVMASNDGKHWNEEQTARISLTVHAPWWKTGVAYVIYIVLSIAIIAASIRLYIHRTRKEMERKHKEEILLLRIRNLIEQCNRYEAEQKKSPEGKNITCVHSHTEPHQTENKQDASESVFLTKAIELVEKNLHVPGLLRRAAKPRLVYGTHRTLPETGSHARPVPQPLHPQHPLATCGTTHPGRQPQHYGNRRAYRLQQFQLSQQMFPGNVRLPSLGICGENAEINLSVVPFQQDCCHLKGIQGYFCSIILKEP